MASLEENSSVEKPEPTEARAVAPESAPGGADAAESAGKEPPAKKRASLSVSEKVALGEESRQKGNTHFKAGEFKKVKAICL
jgi:hypothetical protein